MSHLYNSVLVGLGNISWKFDVKNGKILSHLPALVRNKHVEVVAGCSPSKNDRELFNSKHNISTYSDFEEMLKKEAPDIVSICSPAEFHYQHLKQCIQSNIKMVWLEKPALENCEQLNYLISQNNSTKIVVNYQRRYSSSYQKLKDIVDNSTYGKPALVEVRYSRGLMNNGSHMIDILFFILSIDEYKLLWVENDIESESPSFAIRDKRGFLIIVSGVEASFHNIDFSITFEDKRFSILHNDMDLRVEDKVEHEFYPNFYRLADSNTSIFCENEDSPFVNALSDLINSYENDYDTISNLSTIYKTHELIEKILKS